MSKHRHVLRKMCKNYTDDPHAHTVTCWRQNENLSDSHCWQTRGNKHGGKFCFVSDSGRKSRVERGFVRGVAVWQWGSIGLTSRGLGLWGRKRHRQEVRAGQNSLEMLYHHYQQATDSHQGCKKLRGLRVCAYVCISVPLHRDRSTWMHVCVTNITLSSRVFRLHADIVWFQPAPAKDLRKAFGFVSVLSSLSTIHHIYHQRKVNRNCLVSWEERRGVERSYGSGWHSMLGSLKTMT